MVSTRDGTQFSDAICRQCQPHVEALGSWCDRLGLGEGRGERCDSSASVTTPIGTPPANGGSASATARHTAYTRSGRSTTTGQRPASLYSLPTG